VFKFGIGEIMNYIGKMVEIVFRNALKEDEIKGTILPSSTDKTYILKLKNGYNVGILKENIVIIKETQEKMETIETIKEKKVSQDINKPKVLIFSVGGTIASKIDYNTGGVSAQFSADDLLNLIPELKSLANIEAYSFSNLLSENITSKHWEEIAKAVYKKIKDGEYKGIIITHGTDTLHYTSGALSFLLNGTNIPIILVGAQRSSDRPSSDSTYNLLGAVKFILESKKGGVFVSLHSGNSDNEINIILGTRARKMHSSKRDAFKSINKGIVAKVIFDLRNIKNSKVEFFEAYNELNSEQKLTEPGKLNNKVYLLKFFPGQDPQIISYLKKEGYKIVIIEGTGLGHVADNFIDFIRKEKDIVFFMTVQTIYGRTNMGVYSTGIKLKDAGVIELKDMLSEVAFVKGQHVLGKTDKKAEIIDLMTKPLFFEMGNRTEE